MDENAVTRLRTRVEELEQAMRDVQLLISDFNADIRRDVHMTMTPIGVDLYDVRRDIRALVEATRDLAQSMALLQQWAGAQDAQRVERQGALDTQLEAQNAQLDAMHAEIRRPWWRRGKP